MKKFVSVVNSDGEQENYWSDCEHNKTFWQILKQSLIKSKKVYLSYLAWLAVLAFAIWYLESQFAIGYLFGFQLYMDEILKRST